MQMGKKKKYFTHNILWKHFHSLDGVLGETAREKYLI